MSYLRNYKLSKSKKLSSSIIPTLTAPHIRKLKKQIYTIIDELFIDQEGESAKDILTSHEEESIFQLLSCVLHQGFSHVTQKKLALKANVSIPTVRKAIHLLIELGIIQQVHARAKGKNSASVYILTLHPNYMKVLQYIKDDYAIDVPVAPIFSQYFSLIFSLSKPENSSQTRDESYKTDSNLSNPVNLKEMYKDIYDMNESSNLAIVENEPEVYAIASGVPEEVVQELKKGLPTTEIIKIWTGLQRTLNKYQMNYDYYKQQIIDAIRHTFATYKSSTEQTKVKYNFTGCVCGYLLKKVKTLLLDTYHERWSEWMRGETAITGEPMLLNTYENVTAHLLGLFLKLAKSGSV